MQICPILKKLDITGPLTGDKYPRDLRLIGLNDKVKTKALHVFNEQLQTCSNNDSQIYKSRCQIELPIKWSKQSLKIKSFLGTSKKAVLTQIWVAMCYYLFLTYIKHQNFCLPMARSFSHLLVLSISIGLFSVISLPASSALLVHEGNVCGMGLAMGIFNSAMNLGAVVALLGGGLVLEFFGINAVFHAAGFMGLMGIIFFYFCTWWVASPRKNRSRYLFTPKNSRLRPHRSCILQYFRSICEIDIDRFADGEEMIGSKNKAEIVEKVAAEIKVSKAAAAKALAVITASITGQ